jgi:hypothetical protein
VAITITCSDQANVHVSKTGRMEKVVMRVADSTIWHDSIPYHAYT